MTITRSTIDSLPQPGCPHHAAGKTAAKVMPIDPEFFIQQAGLHGIQVYVLDKRLHVATFADFGAEALNAFSFLTAWMTGTRQGVRAVYDLVEAREQRPAALSSPNDR
jgi:hypothetical protein